MKQIVVSGAHLAPEGWLEIEVDIGHVFQRRRDEGLIYLFNGVVDSTYSRE